ncbi:MAG: YqeG family HAD IIIA-type phosphatase [Anaerolineae bacterium]
MNSDILSRFIPDLVVSTVSDIPLDRVEQAGIRGFLFDLDNTLLAHYGEVVEPDVLEWLGNAEARGFRLAMVTNAGPQRALPLADRLEMPCIYRARKPLRRGVRAGVKMLGLPPEQVAMVGDQLFTDVWAGRRVGTYTIWVRPEAPVEPITTSFKRPLEWLVTRLIGMRDA